MENKITDKTMVVLLRGGGRIWITQKEAEKITSVKLGGGSGSLDIGGELVEIKDIKAVVSADTYQTTNEARSERINAPTDTNLPATRSECRTCSGYGFVIKHRDDPIYDTYSVPCPDCNPNPPELKY